MFLILVRILYAWFYNPEPVFGPQPEGGAPKSLRFGIGKLESRRPILNRCSTAKSLAEMPC